MMSDEGQDAAGGELVEHHPDRREVLLHGWRRLLAAKLLDIGRDVDRGHSSDRRHVTGLQPRAKLADRPHVGPGEYAGCGSGR